MVHLPVGTENTYSSIRVVQAPLIFYWSNLLCPFCTQTFHFENTAMSCV